MQPVPVREDARETTREAPAPGAVADRRRLERLLLLLILVVALASRLLYVAALPQLPVVSDASGYDAAARRLLAGRGFAFPLGQEAWRDDVVREDAWGAYLEAPRNAFSMPGYPAFLAAVYAVTGTGSVRFFAVRVVQCLLGALSLLVLFRLADRVLGRRVAWVALLLAAAYLPAIQATGYLLSETLFTLLFLLQLSSMVAADRVGTARAYALVGLTTAIAAYVRPIALLFPLALAALVFARALRAHPSRPDALRGLGRLLVAGAVALALLAPWSVRNTVLYRTFVPLTSASQLAHVQWLTVSVTKVMWTATLAQELDWRSFGDDHRAAIGVSDYILARLPRTTVAERTGLTPHGLSLVWAMASSPAEFFGTQYSWPSWQYVLQCALLALAAAGAAMRRREPWAVAFIAIPPGLIVAHLLTATLLPRYFLPVTPLLMVLAAAPLVSLAEAAVPALRAAAGPRDA